MKRTVLRLATFAGLALLWVCLLSAQNWQTADTLPGVDLNGLTGSQRATALKLLRARGCSCGCSMKVAECRVADPSCSYSTGLAQVIVAAIREGKSEAQALQLADNSRYAKPASSGKVLDDAVNIPIVGAPSAGPANAPITVVEFSDFQCPYCAQAIPEIESLQKLYPQQMRLVFKQYPLDNHPNAGIAAAAALAAQKQGKFWQMHDALFANRTDLSRPNLIALAKQNGLDVKRFEQDMDSDAVRESIARDTQDGDKAGVEGTPTIFINGQKFNGAIEVAALRPIFDETLKKTSTPAGATASATVKR
ncbi:MAG TPA: thioredoxin domain-containing protein [Bryobacteraceae bacterium]|jgi:protein-disulfide isomerase|nr:thioredoxin domain-containing protein [Bryobacteraceae bacterium]